MQLARLRMHACVAVLTTKQASEDRNRPARHKVHLVTGQTQTAIRPMKAQQSVPSILKNKVIFDSDTVSKA